LRELKLYLAIFMAELMSLQSVGFMYLWILLPANDDYFSTLGDLILNATKAGPLAFSLLYHLGLGRLLVDHFFRLKCLCPTDGCPRHI